MFFLPSAISRSLRAALANSNLRRVQLALAGTALTTPAYGVALSVYAYRAGGLSAVALAGVVTFLPAGLLAPVLSVLADRHRRERVLAAALLFRGLTLAASALCILGSAAPAAVLALAALSSIASRVVRPAQAALVPSLARNDGELTAANALSATIDEVGALVGPALAGAVLVVGGPGPMVGLCAAAALGAALLARGLPESDPPEAAEDARLLPELAAGFSVIVGTRYIRLPAFLLTLQTAAYGAVSVLMVPLAIDVVGMGDSGLGAAEMALGIGGILGGIAALGVVAGGRLGICLAGGCALWGGAVALLGLYPQALAVLAGFAAVGATSILVDVPAYTLIQQATPDAILGRVFGALEGMGVLGTALGAAAAPVLVAVLGLPGAFVAVGVALLAPALLGWRMLQELDYRASGPGTASRASSTASSSVIEAPSATSAS